MEDDKLKQIFSDYNPHLSPDVMFMSRLEQNLRSVEFIKERTNTAIRRNKAAMLIACAVGFIAGTGFSLAFPLYIGMVQIFGRYKSVGLANYHTCQRHSYMGIGMPADSGAFIGVIRRSTRRNF